ncbi:hypothetical protein [Taibaiella chishuiensis]|uniref:Uncharacterized protein n=1 Tax=Taibaiella chishuiensis TaxID=1434707 RepID=A0A2P8D9Z2_9BACT|nr:hypothetical protein [Taibaiella chishuiensis]PSK94032.1 hypothetical protein B0I18_101182 [Taibaiella chishuiensis]
MKNSNYRWQLTFTLLALVLGSALYFFFTHTDNSPAPPVTEHAPAFGPDNFNVMKLDTFVALVRSNYAGVTIQPREDKVLDLSVKIDKNAPGSFFNNNDALLQYKLNDYGFDIKYNPGEEVVRALFRIDEQQGVPVPNDVLLRLTGKINTTPTKHVDSAK